MKNRWLILSLMMLVAAAGAYAEGEKECPMPTPPPASKELEQIKSLEGRWVGTGMDKEKETVVEYRVTSGGTAVAETLGPGTAHEMISMYHDVNGKLSMTHYCMLGNQPELELVSATPEKLELKESAASAVRLAGQMRMSSLAIERPDKDTLVQTWTAQDAQGKPDQPSIFKFKRT